MTNTSEILKDLIKTDIQSKRPMYNGVEYYRGDNDIKGYDFRSYYVDAIKYTDYNKSNTKIVNNFQKKLVDQKVGYIVGKPMTIKSDDAELIEKIEELLGEKKADILAEWVKGASNKAWESLHVYINEFGEFDYTVIPAQEIIFITDTSYEQNIVQVIRYYKIEWVKQDKTEESIRVEIWDKEKVTFYQEDEDEFFLIPEYTMGIEANPRFHWTTLNTATGVIEQASWGKVPFIKLRNNSEETTDLKPIKDYIDAMDIVSSGFINDLKDIQLAIWVLRGYEGTDLGEFMLNLQKFKAIKLSTDDNASAEPKTMDIPKEARVAILAWLEEKIYDIGQGVNTARLSGGSITNVVIKAHYVGLDLKSNLLITKMKRALSEFMWFAVEYINDRDNKTYNYKDIKFVFNRSMIFNELELVEMINKSSILLSKKTQLANHPLVDDVEAELQLIEDELDDIGFKEGE